MKRCSVCKLLLVALLTAVTLTGCGATKKASTDAGQSSQTSETEAESSAESGAFPKTTESSQASESTQGEDEIDPETMDFIKYNIYVEMNNYIIKILDNITNYYTVVANEEEFSLLPDSGYTYGYRIIGLNSDIIDDALTISQMEPAYETLDTLAQQIAEPMKTLMDTFSDISKTYSFADNQYAKPKEFHTIVYTNTADFVDLAYQFLDNLTIIADERVLAEEEKMKSEGQLIAYNASHVITIANQIINECYDQGVDDYNLTELDLSKIQPLYDELVATVDAFNAATSDNNQLIKESISNSRPFDGLFDSLIQALEWMIKQVENKTPLDDPSRTPLGSLGHVGEVLSDCINRYNSIFAQS